MKCFAAKAVICIIIGSSILFAGFYGLLKEERYYTIDQQEFYSNSVHSSE